MTEYDYLKFKGEKLFSVLDVWSYAYALLPDEIIAEFLVANALNVDKAENITYWTAYDMSYRKKRIEVKATSYVHAWNKGCVSKVRNFSIEPTSNEYWTDLLLEKDEKNKRSRQSEVYVFCINENQDISRHDPINVDFWNFYVIPTYIINLYAEKNKYHLMS